MVSETIIYPRYGETDQMGVIYHSNYFRYFEVGRTDFYKAIGFSYKVLESEGVLFPVLECGCTFVSPAHYDEEVIVRTRLESFKFARFRMHYDIVRFDDGVEKRLVSGFTEHAFANRDLKPVNIKKTHPHLYEVLKKSLEDKTHAL